MFFFYVHISFSLSCLIHIHSYDLTLCWFWHANKKPIFVRIQIQTIIKLSTKSIRFNNFLFSSFDLNNHRWINSWSFSKDRNFERSRENKRWSFDLSFSLSFSRTKEHVTLWFYYLQLTHVFSKCFDKTRHFEKKWRSKWDLRY